MRLSRDEKGESESFKEEEGVGEREDLVDDTTLNKEEDDDLMDDYDLYGDDFLGEASPAPLTKHTDLLKSLTNFDPYIKEAINNWMGLIWSDEKKSYVENPGVTKIMNMNGALWCSGLMKTYARGNNIITDISKEEYKQIMADHIEAIWLNLGTRDDLGIREDGDLLRVSNELEHAAALALMGAGDGKYNKFLGTTITRNEQIRPGDDGSGVMRSGMNSNIKGQGGILRQLKRVMTGK